MPDRTLQLASLAFESLLLDEVRHRHANEFAAAAAALSLVRASGSVDHPLLDQAIQRMDASARIERLLTDPRTPDLGDAVARLCSLITVSRTLRPTFSVKVVGSPAIEDLTSMRMLLRVAYELLANAAKNTGLAGSAISVRVAASPDSLRLTVVNRRDEREAGTSLPGSGIEILRRLARPLTGTVACREEGGRFVVQAIFPTRSRTPRTPVE